MPYKRSIDEGKGSCLVFPLRSKAQEDSKTRENRPLSEELLRLPAAEDGEGVAGFLLRANDRP